MLRDIFPACPVVGMVHLLPLPGAVGWSGSMKAVLDRARTDARALAGGGLSGLMVENYSDVPFLPEAAPASTIAAMAVAVQTVRAVVGIPVGVNVLRNDGAGALAVAVATGASFIRVNVHTGSMFTDQGLLHGRAHETMRLRASLGTDTAVIADVFVKHAAPTPGTRIEDAARDAVERGLADGLIVSGRATGSAADPEDLERVKAAVSNVPVWVGSGVTADSVGRLLDVADGLIVGSALQEGGVAGSPVDPARVERFMEAVATH